MLLGEWECAPHKRKFLSLSLSLALYAHTRERESDDQLGKHNTVTVALHAISRYKSWRRLARSLWELHIPLSHKYIYSLQILPHRVRERAATSNDTSAAASLKNERMQCVIVRDLHQRTRPLIIFPSRCNRRTLSRNWFEYVQSAGLAGSARVPVPDDNLVVCVRNVVQIQMHFCAPLCKQSRIFYRSRVIWLACTYFQFSYIFFFILCNYLF
jgi:hypothetical protein